jgi:hypothetical protein
MPIPLGWDGRRHLCRLLKVSLASAVVVVGVWGFADWCEDLLISRRLHQRLQAMRSLRLAGLDGRDRSWVDAEFDDDPEQRRVPDQRLVSVLSMLQGASAVPIPIGRFRAVVREPVYALRMDLVRWHGFSETWRVGCLHLGNAEIAVQSRSTDEIPPLCRAAAERF